MPELPESRLEGGAWCHEVLELLDAYVDGALTPEQRATAEAHLAGCTVCASFGATYAAVVDRLRRAPSTPHPLEPERAARLERRLADALETP